MAKKSTATGKKRSTSNSNSLVIVESPAKAKTISKYLGRGYTVKASMGHVRDLPPKSYGIDLQAGFEPTYESVPRRAKLLAELKKAADKADIVYLATDLDREGEAIAWHLAAALELDENKIKRVVFNEITKSAITESFANPRRIDMDKVNAQQARRILDRIVGYELSPLLWKKIAKGLSAGRVQSVAVRLIVERETGIRRFVPAEHWRVHLYFATEQSKLAELTRDWLDFLECGEDPDDGRTQKERTAWLSKHVCLEAELVKLGGENFKPTSVAEARQAAELLGFVCEEVEEKVWEQYADKGLATVDLIGRTPLENAPPFSISRIETRRTKSKAPAPFTTATLQQAASSQLGFSASRTMRVAQQLYEGIDLGEGQGAVGLITYMRTDSTHLSNESVAAAREHIREQYGDKYLPDKPNRFGKAKRAQEAHEAIRPTDAARPPEYVKSSLNAEHLKLYGLIYKRFIACQMLPAEWDGTTVFVTCQTAKGEASLKAGGRKLVFDGFYKVAGIPASSGELILPGLSEDQPVWVMQVDPEQHFTSPPPRYTEASLVKRLEAEGIGRPSTYAAIIQTVQDRGYVEQIDRRFYATDKGQIVTEKLVEHFPRIMDVQFTSHMEDELDKIEDAHLDWVRVLHEFYDPFHQSLEIALENMQPVRAEPSEYTCEKCEKPMVYRWAKTGRFLSCSGYPECKNAMNVNRDGQPLIPKSSDHKCELCGKPMTLRQSRHGPFLGCSGYPECTHTIACDAEGEPLRLVTEEELEQPCELCGGTMKVRRRGVRAFLGCDQYPKCKNTGPIPDDVRLEHKPAPPPEEAGINCDRCGKPMVIRNGKRGKFIACSGFPRCRNTKPAEKLEQLKAATDAGEPPEETPAKTAGKTAKKTTRKKTAKKTSKKAAASSAARDPKASKYTLGRTGKPCVEEITGPIYCPECGEEMAVKPGRWGPFLSCTGFPKCKMTGRLKGAALEQAKAKLGEPEQKPKPIPTDIVCEECGANMVIRTGRSGQFLGCGNYPKCKTTKPLPPELINAPAASTS